jgi:hypothetical protein
MNWEAVKDWSLKEATRLVKISSSHASPELRMIAKLYEAAKMMLANPPREQTRSVH